MRNTKNSKVVYQHRRLDTNEIFYVGIGKIDRAYDSQMRNKLWKKITNKTKYSVEIIEKNLSWESACKLESKLIQKYGRIDMNTGTLANHTNGGDGIYGLSDKTKKQISETQKGISYEERFGKKKANQLKKLRSEQLNQNNPAKLEHVKKQLIQRNIENNPMNNEESRKKISKALKGRIPWNKGIKWKTKKNR